MNQTFGKASISPVSVPCYLLNMTGCDSGFSQAVCRVLINAENTWYVQDANDDMQPLQKPRLFQNISWKPVVWI